MKEFYYYIRDKENKPRITVCLLKSKGGLISKGVALCCMKDNPCKKTGRELAKKRAKLALYNGTHCLQMTWRKNIIANGFFHFKAYFQPTLTQYEGQILYGGFGI